MELIRKALRRWLAPRPPRLRHGPRVLLPLRGFPSWVLQEIEFAPNQRGQLAANLAEQECRARRKLP